MRIVFTLLYYDPADTGRSLPDYLGRVSTLSGLPQALAARGHQVAVVHLFPEERTFTREGVDYYFIPAGTAARGLGRSAGRLLGRDPLRATPALAAARRVRALAPEVVHYLGTVLALNLWLLRRVLGPAGPPILLHDHGGRPPTDRLWRRLQRANLAAVARWLVTTPAAADAYAGLWPGDDERLTLFPEISTPFRWQPRPAARAQTGIEGDPVYLATGRLAPVKDPLTLLAGFDLIRRQQPAARLYWYYLTDELLPELKAFAAARPGLANAVHWRGRAPRNELEAVYNSADFFLQASRREVAGYALLEALACGVIPIVSDIPAFRQLTAGGRYGRLFAPGDPAGLAAAALAVGDRPALSAAVHVYFMSELSDTARAGRLEGIYAKLAGK